jgi:hypothetical protein
MWKEVVQSMETGALAYVGLFAFIFAFTLIVIRVALMKKKERMDAKNMPLDEEPEFFADNERVRSSSSAQTN